MKASYGTHFNEMKTVDALQVWEAAAGLQDSLHFQHGELSSAVQQCRPPQHGSQPDSFLHPGLSVPLFPAPALGVGRAEQPRIDGGHAGCRSHLVHALRVSSLHLSYDMCFFGAHIQAVFKVCSEKECIYLSENSLLYFLYHLNEWLN